MSHARNVTEAAQARYDVIPDQFKERDRWLLWSHKTDPPKKPRSAGNYDVDYANSDEWLSFEEARELAETSPEFDGIHYAVLEGDDEYVIDIDGPYDDQGEPRAWFPGLDPFEDAGAYMERSPSGNGIHIPVEGEPPAWWKDSEVDPDKHQGVDVLAKGACSFTGDRLETAGEEVTDINAAPFLFTCYEEIRGESPRFDTEEADSYDGEEWLDDEDIEAALSEIDPDLPHTEWVKLGYAVHDYDDGSTGKRLFTEWSKEGQKWDRSAKQSIESIWSGAGQGQGVTVATLVHTAKKAGWEPPSGSSNPTPEPGEGDDDESNFTLTPNGVMRAAFADPYGRHEIPEDGGKKPTIHDLRNPEAATYVWDVMEATGRDDVLAVSNGNLRAYDDGVWIRDGEQQLREYGRQGLHSAYSSRVLEQLKEETRARQVVDPDDLGAPEGTVAVENGLLHLLERDGSQLEELKRKHRAIRQLNVTYNPEANPPTRWRQFLDDSIRDEEDRKKLQEYFGYCLWHHAQPFGKALFLLGPTDSGKGTALKTLQGILGEENVAMETLYDLLQTRWGAAGIYGKAANIRNEVTPGGIKNIQRFKELTGGGDRITAEYKGQDKFEFTVTQKFLFATNEVPTIESADEAFYNRCLFVRFPDTVPEEEQDKQLLDKLLEEKAGILNWMLAGLRRLMEQGHFTGEREIAGKKELCDAFGSVTDRFIHNCLEVTGESDLLAHKGDIHNFAKIYAEWIDKEPDWNSQRGFTIKMKESSGIDDKQSQALTGDNTRVFTGIRPSPEAVEELTAALEELDLEESELEIRWTRENSDTTQGQLGG